MHIPQNWYGRPLRGELSLPGDKSISHRAALLASLAHGTSYIDHFAPGGDCRSTLRCLEMMGIQARQEQERLIVQGLGLRGFHQPSGSLDAGNSGTTMRLMSGILAGQRFASVIDGDSSLRQRPMERVLKPLRLMGAQVAAADGHGHAPLSIQGGALQGIRYEMDVASAQVKSALLLAGLYARGQTSVIEPAPTRDHTERMLRGMGASVTNSDRCITLEPVEQLHPLQMTVPGDFSTAAFFIAAAVSVPGSELLLKGVGVNPTRTGFLTIIERMGGSVELLNHRDEGGEPVADIRCVHRPLHGASVDGDLISLAIDELPLVAVLATQARGVTEVRGAQELRVKESDRIAAMARGLMALGAKIVELDDGWSIAGSAKLGGASVDSAGDHRVAMALAIAALHAQGATQITGSQWVGISTPAFYNDLSRLLQV
ncbi:MAG: 3-phosphoshikimate 1-carboxyvinyltransferase [Bacillota bacterium]